MSRQSEWSGFPEHGTAGEKLRFLTRFAILAPSSHNSQPWRFRVRARELELHADRSRALPISDPDRRELVLSCGAALFTLRVAIRFAGHRDRSQALPRPNEPDFLARIELADIRVPDASDCALFQAIARRRTNRGRFHARPVPGGIVSALQAAAHAEGAWLHIIAEEQERLVTAELIAEADRVQNADPAFRRELAAWMRPSHGDCEDGIPGYALGLGSPGSRVPFLVRTFDMGDGRAAQDREIALGSPCLAVLGTAEDSPSARLAAGEALGRVLLTACAEGLSASHLNQVVEVSHLRSALRESLGLDGFPQIVLRLGYGDPVPATPRRPVEDVLIEDEPPAA